MGAKAENFSFLKKLLENIKQMKDAQHPENTLTNEVGIVFTLLKVLVTYYGMDDTAKGGLAQFWELFTVIPCAPRHLKRK